MDEFNQALKNRIAELENELKMSQQRMNETTIPVTQPTTQHSLAIQLAIGKFEISDLLVEKTTSSPLIASSALTTENTKASEPTSIKTTFSSVPTTSWDPISQPITLPMAPQNIETTLPTTLDRKSVV